jgi:PAS domain S-box-containing protein
MFYLDSDGLVLEANERWYEMTGYPKDSPNTISWTDSIHPDSLSVMEQGLPQMFSGSAWSGELKLKKPWVDPMTGDCLDYWILAASQPERSLDGAIKSVMGSITDISYMKWAEGLRNRRLEEAEETRRQQNSMLVPCQQ